MRLSMRHEHAVMYAIITIAVVAAIVLVVFNTSGH